jgi:hypothetical protein
MALSKFGAAFKAARARGDKTFTFGGKSYTTKTKDDEAKKPDVSKAKAGPAEYETKKAPPMDEATKARVLRNKLEQAAMKGKPEIIKPVDKSPKKIGEDGKLKNVNPVGMPERRRLGPRTEAPEIMKTPGKADDTSLSVSERIKNARERARTSDTGTDKRSVSDRLKSAFGTAASMAAGPGAAIARSAGKVAEEAKKEKGMKKGGSVKGYGKARGGRACKMR